MTDTEKINEELRNFKLFKIQRTNVKKQEFDEVKEQIITANKNELIDYFIVLLSSLSIPYLIYNLIKSSLNSNFYTINKSVIIINFLIVIIAYCYTSYKLVIYIKILKKQYAAVENAIQHFSNESEVLKAEYESYVNNYLEKK